MDNQEEGRVAPPWPCLGLMARPFPISSADLLAISLLLLAAFIWLLLTQPLNLSVVFTDLLAFTSPFLPCPQILQDLVFLGNPLETRYKQPVINL